MSALGDSTERLLGEVSDAQAQVDAQWRARLGRLMWELHEMEVLSEQQCAKYMALDLVSMREIFDAEALGATSISHEDAQDK